MVKRGTCFRQDLQDQQDYRTRRSASIPPKESFRAREAVSVFSVVISQERTPPRRKHRKDPPSTPNVIPIIFHSDT